MAQLIFDKGRNSDQSCNCKVENVGNPAKICVVRNSKFKNLRKFLNFLPLLELIKKLRLKLGF